MAPLAARAGLWPTGDVGCVVIKRFVSMAMLDSEITYQQRMLCAMRAERMGVVLEERSLVFKMATHLDVEELLLRLACMANDDERRSAPFLPRMLLSCANLLAPHAKDDSSGRFTSISYRKLENVALLKCPVDGLCAILLNTTSCCGPACGAHFSLKEKAGMASLRCSIHSALLSPAIDGGAHSATGYVAARDLSVFLAEELSMASASPFTNPWTEHFGMPPLAVRVLACLSLVLDAPQHMLPDWGCAHF